MASSTFHSSTIIQELRKKIRHISAPLLYSALLMFYAFKRNETPSWAKRIILGALVYLIVPVDAIPDISPVIGYTDDLGVLMYGLVMVAAYINDKVRSSARQTLQAWIGPVNESVLSKIDRLL